MDRPRITYALDLGARTYETVSRLRDRIIRKARSLEGYPGSPRMLRVGIPDDMVASAEQLKELQRLTVELGQRGVELITVPIR